MTQYNLAANPPVNNLITDIKSLIQEARSGLAATVNAELTLLYWRIGSRIRQDVLGGERAGYGDQVIQTVSARLEVEHGRGFSAKSLRHMVRFAEVFASEDIVSAVRRQLSCRI